MYIVIVTIIIIAGVLMLSIMKIIDIKTQLIATILALILQQLYYLGQS